MPCGSIARLSAFSSGHAATYITFDLLGRVLRDSGRTVRYVQNITDVDDPLIERVDRPNVGVTLDNVNLIRLGDDMLDGTRILAPLTRMVQLKDHLAGDPTVWGGPICVALGEGVADLPAILAILGDAGFGGAVCVELASLGGDQVDELAMIERSVEWLRRSLPG